MSEVSISPGKFVVGPERDAARKAKTAFHRWLWHGHEREAVLYRDSVDLVNRARRERSTRRREALRAFKRLYAEGRIPAEGSGGA